jgi:hypothetical protein
MGFLKKTEGRRSPEMDPDQLAVERLRKAGADPNVPHETRHFLYVPGVKAAQELARTLKRPDRQVEVETSARKGYWLVAVIERVVVTPQTIAAHRAEFEAAARPYNGEYDYWQVDVAGD